MPKTGPGVARPKAKKRTAKAPKSFGGRRAVPPGGGGLGGLSDDDDEDATGYMRKRHAEKPGKGTLDDSDDDDDEEEDVEEVMALRGMDDDDDDDEDDEEEDDDDDEEDDDDDEGNPTGLAAMSDDDDEDDDDDEEGEDVPGSLGWGGKRQDLYGGQDGEDEDDDDDELPENEKADKLEAAEALRLQKAHASRLRAEDFGELDAAIAAAGGSGELGHDAALGRQLDAELAELPKALRGKGKGSVRVESVARDMAGLSEEQLKRAVAADAPELLHLLGDFKETLRDARTRVAPLLSAARQAQLQPESGMKLLQVKLQLMLSYATNIGFYLMLKAQGRAVREHPVIDALLRHRLLLERLRPLEQKSAYRLSKLLQLAAAEADEGHGGKGGGLRDLSERPNPDALLTKAGGARAAAGSGDEDDDEDDEEGGGGGGVYRPPKIAAVPYEEEPGMSKKQRQKERQLQRASASRLVRELREELSEGPRAIHADDFGSTVDADSAAVARFRKEEDARRQYEEANFKRLSLTKEEKRAERRRRNAASGVAVDDLGTFDDFSHLYDVAKRSNEAAADPAEERMRALKQYMNSIEQRGGGAGGRKGAAGKKRGADDDAPQRTREERTAKMAKRSAAMASAAGDDDDGGGGFGGRAVPEEDSFYREMEAQQRQRKEGKAERRRQAEEEEREERRRAPTDSVADGEAREAGRQIEKNRGLTRERKKIDANPRVKNREKFRKATIRRKGQVRNVAEASAGPYAGEATGIKKNVSHSTRFK